MMNSRQGNSPWPYQDQSYVPVVLQGQVDYSNINFIRTFPYEPPPACLHSYFRQPPAGSSDHIPVANNVNPMTIGVGGGGAGVMPPREGGSHYNNFLLMNRPSAPFPLRLEVRGSWHERLSYEAQHYSAVGARSRKKRLANHHDHNSNVSQPEANFGMNQHVPFTCKMLTFVLRKELKMSDVSNLKRIILPKREAERCLPSLFVKQGMDLVVRDVLSHEIWAMKFRFWQNNRGRIYVLENTGAFVNKYDLKCGDYLALYEDENRQLYIYAKKSEAPLSSRSSIIQQDMDEDNNQMEMQQQPMHQYSNDQYSQMEMQRDSNMNSGWTATTAQNEFEESPVFDEYGLSRYDLRPGGDDDAYLILK